MRRLKTTRIMSPMRVPHYVAIGLALASVVVTWIMQQSADGNLVLPAVAVTVLTVAKTVLQLFSDAPQTAAQKAAAKLGPIVAFGLLAGASGSQTGCAALQASKIPADTQALEECVANALIAGDTDPVSIGVKCDAPEGTELVDVVEFLAQQLEGNGKVAIGTTRTVKSHRK